MAEYKQMSQVNPLKLQAGPADLNKIEVPSVGERPGDSDGHNTDIVIGGLIFHYSTLFKMHDSILFRTLLTGLQRARSLRRISLNGRRQSRDLRSLEKLAKQSTKSKQI